MSVLAKTTASSSSGHEHHSTFPKVATDSAHRMRLCVCAPGMTVSLARSALSKAKATIDAAVPAPASLDLATVDGESAHVAMAVVVHVAATEVADAVGKAACGVVANSVAGGAGEVATSVLVEVAGTVGSLAEPDAAAHSAEMKPRVPEVKGHVPRLVLFRSVLPATLEPDGATTVAEAASSTGSTVRSFMSVATVAASVAGSTRVGLDVASFESDVASFSSSRSPRRSAVCKVVTFVVFVKAQTDVSRQSISAPAPPSKIGLASMLALLPNKGVSFALVRSTRRSAVCKVVTFVPSDGESRRWLTPRMDEIEVNVVSDVVLGPVTSATKGVFASPESVRSGLSAAIATLVPACESRG